MTVDTEISIISVIVNSILALLTGIYVLLTYSLLKQARDTASTSERLLQTQMLISTMPRLELRLLHASDGVIELHLTNWGQNPALDVDIWLVGSYDEEEAEGIKDRITLDYPRGWEHDSDGIYYIVERIMRPVVSGEHKLVERLFIPETGSVNCFFQYRAVNGDNLWKLVWLFRQTTAGKQSYKIGMTQPTVQVPTERVEYETDQDGRFSFAPSGPVFKDETFDREFIHAYELSIPCGWLEGHFSGVEDRGKIVRLN